MINKLLVATLTITLFAVSLFGQKKTNGSRVIEGTINYCADAGANDTYACSLDPAIVAYTEGACYTFKANTANTGAATINLNSVGAKDIKKVQGGVTTTLSDNDIRSGQVVNVCYDGTNMQMQSTLGNTPVGVGTVTSVTANSASELSITDTTTTPVISVADAFDISGKTSTAPIKKGTSLPATCSVGMLYFKTDATNTNVLYACTASNTWTAQGTAATYSVDTTVAPVWMWGDPLPGGGNTAFGAERGMCHKFVVKHEIVSTNFGFYVGTGSGTCSGTCGFAIRLFDSTKTSIAVSTVVTSGGSPNLNTTGWKKTTWDSGSAVSTGVLTLQPGVYFECHGTDSTVLALYDMGNATWQEIENSEAANSHGYSAVGYVTGSGGSIALSTTFPASLTHSGGGATTPYFRFQ